MNSPNPTKPPNPNPPPEPGSNRRLWLLLLSRTSIALGVILLAGLAGGAWWLWIFINEQLAPLVEKNLTQTLNRPVQVGRVQQFSLTGLRFGASSVPATPTDPDRVSIETVEVAFDPLQLVFTRTLKLDVTLVNPDVYIEQDKQGRWVSSTLAAQEATGPIKTELDTIRFRNADVVLVPNTGARSSGLGAREGTLRVPESGEARNASPPSPQPLAPSPSVVAIAQVNGAAQFLENNQLIQFDLGGQMATGGTFTVEGESRPKTEEINLQLQGQNVLASDISRLVELPLELQAGRVDGNLKIQLRSEQLVAVFGSGDAKGVTAQVPQLPQAFNNTQGTLRFQGMQVHLDNVKTSYGKVPLVANGVIDTKAGYNVSARVKAVSVANGQQTLGLQLPVTATGELQASAKLTGPILAPILSGTVATTKPARIDRVNFSNIRTNFALSTAASLITFKDIQATPTVGGKITGAGKIKLALTPPNSPPSKEGTLENQLNFDFVARNVPGDAIAKTYGVSPQIQVGTVSARAEISGTPTTPQTVVRWQAPQATYPAQGRLVIAGTNNLSLRDTIVNVAGGTVRASGQLVNGRWQASVQGDGIQPGRLAQVPPTLQAPLSGTFNLSGTIDSFQPETIRATGSGRVNIAGGTVTASNFQLEQGRWQSEVRASQVQLDRFSEQLQGQLSGQLRLAGMTDTFSPTTISAAGQVRFSQGLGLLQQPLTAVVNWDGEKIIVERATSPNLSANGVIYAKVSGPGAPEITGLNLDVQAQNYNLQTLPLQQLPNTVKLAGRADFTGNVSGTLPVPNIKGSLQLENFVVNDLAFDPVLSGNVQLQAGRGVALELSGNQDRIAVNLDPNYRPTSFLVRRDQAVATGQTQGENLLVNIENFPLTALNITPPNTMLGSGAVAGVLTGDFEINPATYAVVGDVAIAKPAVGNIKGDRLVAQFRYANGRGTLTNAEFVQGRSRYALRGTLNQTPSGPEFQGQANITQGQIQQVLAALQFFDLQDFGRGLQPPTYARASDINTVAVGLGEAPLLTQLRRFSEIEALVQAQRQQRDASPVPSLADLQGTFGGEISLNGSLQKGVEANFELQGNNWQWGPYTANRVIASGGFENGVLTLVPLRIESEETLLAFNGQVGTTQQSGQLRVRNFPVETLDSFVRLPVDISGELNATATLAGSLENPQAVGELQLAQGTLNQKPVESATASFSYNDARLNFGSNVVVSGPEPIQVTGSVPVPLPFAKAKPDSNEISLNVNVQDEGLALLNLFTNQVAWQQGEGRVQLQVSGTIQQPVATGIATVSNATISAQALPEPLTDVTGTARFNLDRIVVEDLQGNFSQGNVQASGVIPIFEGSTPRNPNFTNPLTVNLNQLELNLKGLYRGGANGNVVITGSAFSPIIGGEVRLAEGQVLLSQSANAAISGVNSSPASPASRQFAQRGEPPHATGSPASPAGDTVPEFNNLRLQLGEAIEIAFPPVLSFQATGTLDLNGTLNDLRPDGTIRLRGGGVNLFTTQFALARGYEHTATFSPKQGLDPLLDIRLVTTVSEVTQTRVPESASSAEITEPLATDLGSLDTVRVQATIKGPASELQDDLQLTSEPSRSESEIIALLGGSFINTLGRGDSALGLANLAGSALLGSFQGTFTNIGNAFGLSELRIYPTVTTEERADSSALGLAAEAGIDISGDIYFSLVRVLTDAQQPTRFGLVYRLNESFRVRTSTDLSGFNSAVVEYENQF